MKPMELPTGWAIVGRRGRVFRRAERIVRFAGGRSRRKLQMTAAAMNASGEYVVAVQWYGPARPKPSFARRYGPFWGNAELPSTQRLKSAQRAARKARRRGEGR